MPRMKAVDPEEIGKVGEEPMVEKPVTEGEANLLDTVKQMQEEIRRLNAIADQNKGRSYDYEQRDKSFTGFLRHLGEVSDPIISWKSLKNVSYVDPLTSQLVQDQSLSVTTLRGKTTEMDIHEWNMLRSNQTKFKFLRLDHNANMGDIQLSTDGGQSYTGEVIKNLSLVYVNP